jgi:hypothetical protein
MDLDSCEDTLSTAVHEVTSHWQSSFERAAIFLLHPNANDIPPGSLEFGEGSMAYDCIEYLREVTTQPGWRENKLVQALGSPGPGRPNLFEYVVDQLYEKLQRNFRGVHLANKSKVAKWRFCKCLEGNELQRFEWICEPFDESQQWAWDMLEHLYEVMVRDQNPMLEGEDHPFGIFLYIRDRRQAREAAQDMLPPGMDAL